MVQPQRRLLRKEERGSGWILLGYKRVPNASARWGFPARQHNLSTIKDLRQRNGEFGLLWACECDVRGGHRSLRMLQSLFLQHLSPASSPPPPSCTSTSPISFHHRLKRQLIKQTQTPAFYRLVGTFGACLLTNKSTADRAIRD